MKHISDLFEEKARNGDGAFAVAFAILELAKHQKATAGALERLGNGDAVSHFGAIEGLGMQLEKAANIIADSMSKNSPFG